MCVCPRAAWMCVCPRAAVLRYVRGSLFTAGLNNAPSRPTAGRLLSCWHVLKRLEPSTCGEGRDTDTQGQVATGSDHDSKYHRETTED